MKDNEIAALINQIVDLVKHYGHTQQLRTRIAQAVVPRIQGLRTELEQLKEGAHQDGLLRVRYGAKADALNDLIKKMQSDMNTYAVPDGPGDSWFINQTIGHLDGPEQRVAQGPAITAAGASPARTNQFMTPGCGAGGLGAKEGASPVLPGQAAAEKTLRGMGYTYRGGEFWVPPLGVPQWLELVGYMHPDYDTVIFTDRHLEGHYPVYKRRADPVAVMCPGCKPGGVCRTPQCARLKCTHQDSHYSYGQGSVDYFKCRTCGKVWTDQTADASAGQTVENNTAKNNATASGGSQDTSSAS